MDKWDGVDYYCVLENINFIDFGPMEVLQEEKKITVQDGV